MAPVDLGSPYVWLLAIALGIGCFAMRLSFIQLHGWLFEIPDHLESAMRYLPPAILAALAVSFLLVPEGSLLRPLVDERTIAAAAATAVAWRTESMLATVGVGMAVLWGLVFLV